MEPDYSEIYNLEPEDFEWLDLAGEFFKHDGSFSFGYERNGDVIRHGERYDDIEREWMQLEAMYAVEPDHVVEPLMALYKEEDGEREMAGFYVERFEGDLMKNYLSSSMDIQDNLELVKEIEQVVRKFHGRSVVHGDFANNILYDGEDFKVFDPVGIPYDENGYRDMKRCDEEDIEVLRRKAGEPFNDLLERDPDRLI